MILIIALFLAGFLLHGRDAVRGDRTAWLPVGINGGLIAVCSLALL